MRMGVWRSSSFLGLIRSTSFFGLIRSTSAMCCCCLKRERSHSESDEMPSLEEISNDISSDQIQLSQRKRRTDESQRKRRTDEKTTSLPSLPSQPPPWYLVYDKEHGAIPLSKLQKKYNDKT